MTASTIGLPGSLVSAAWLGEHLYHPSLAILDASYYLPAEQRDPRAEYESLHIPGARFFDIDAIADATSALPHMLPTAEQFSADMQTLGLSNDHTIVVYDTHGMFSAPRVWWMLRTFGHRQVAVLDGGLPAWQAAGHSVSSAAEEPPLAASEQPFKATLNRAAVYSRQQVQDTLSSGSAQVIDARSAARFSGEQAETRPGVRSGHMPGAVNLPFTDLLSSPDRHMLPPPQLEQRFTGAGIDLSKPIVTSCGSGVTACVLALALEQLDRPNVAIYDGSWTEWGSASDTEVVCDN